MSVNKFLGYWQFPAESVTPERANVTFRNLLSIQRNEGKKIALMNGCFDVLHAGHIDGTRRAKEELGVHYLIVAVNSDYSFYLNREREPFVDENHRCHALSQLPWIDLVVLFGEKTPLELIQCVKPDVLVKGEEWKGKEIAGREYVEQYGGRMHFLKNRFSIHSSDIVERIRQSVQIGVIVSQGKAKFIQTDTPITVKILDVDSRSWDLFTPDDCIDTSQAQAISNWSYLNEICMREAEKEKKR